MSARLSAMLAPALEYAERKFYVFPCWPRTKKPIPKNGFKAATIDVAKIRDLVDRASGREPRYRVRHVEHRCSRYRCPRRGPSGSQSQR